MPSGIKPMGTCKWSEKSCTTPVQLIAAALDRLQQKSTSPSGATSGDGAALVSLWRWRSQVSPNAQPSGSPALLVGNSAGSRQIGVGTTLPASGSNFFVLNADGSAAWSATVPIGVFADVAAGPSGALYAVTPPAGSCTVACSGALNIITAPGSSGTVGNVQACPAPNVSLGAPPVIVTVPERAVVASTNRVVATAPNVFLFSTSACASPEAALVGTADAPGITASWPTLFLASGQGFTSVDRNSGDTAFSSPAAAYNNGSATVPTLAPPAISTALPINAIFASGSPDDAVRRAFKTTCAAAVPCWQDVGSSFTPGQAGANLSSTPVFDAADIYAADDKAKVYAFSRSAGGAAAWSVDFRAPLPSPWPGNNSAILSPPILLQGGTALVVRSDGVVALASAAGALPLLKMAALTGWPAAPVIDSRGTGSVAYVHAGDGWIYALQLAAPAATPGSNVWPRPGRDSCNSRNAASLCP